MNLFASILIYWNSAVFPLTFVAVSTKSLGVFAVGNCRPAGSGARTGGGGGPAGKSAALAAFAASLAFATFAASLAAAAFATALASYSRRMAAFMFIGGGGGGGKAGAIRRSGKAAPTSAFTWAE